MVSNPELNQMLLDECVYEKPNYQKIEELLKSGAHPLGRVVYCNTLVYCDIVDRCEGKELPKITELFLKYGMDVSKPDIAYKECDETNPLWMFAFYSDEYTLQTLRLLLDHGLDADSAEECWGHILFDYYNCWGYLEDAFCYEMLYDAIRKIMLIASYPHVLQNDKALQKVIWLEYNNYDLKAFRNWNDFSFDIDSSYWGKEKPQVYKSFVTIIEKASGKKVWKFGFGIEPGADR